MLQLFSSVTDTIGVVDEGMTTFVPPMPLGPMGAPDMRVVVVEHMLCESAAHPPLHLPFQHFALPAVLHVSLRR